MTSAGKTRSSADADKPRDAFTCQLRPLSVVAFDMLDMVSYCSAIVGLTLSVKRAVFQIFDVMP